MTVDDNYDENNEWERFYFYDVISKPFPEKYGLRRLLLKWHYLQFFMKCSVYKYHLGKTMK